MIKNIKNIEIPTWAIVATLAIVAIVMPKSPDPHGALHYWAGARHFETTGYFDLYECIASITQTPQRRDLYTDGWAFTYPVHCPSVPAGLVTDLLTIGFKPSMILDKGLNATPVWLATFGRLADLIPYRLIGWVDIIALVAGYFVLVKLTGYRKSSLAYLMALLWYPIVDRFFGHYAQWVWLPPLLIALATKREMVRGMLIGVATSLFIFPVFFLVGQKRRTLQSAAATIALLNGLAVFVAPGGINTTIDFIRNTALHSRTIITEPYNVGWSNAVLSNPSDTHQTALAMRDNDPTRWIVSPASADSDTLIRVAICIFSLVMIYTTAIVWMTLVNQIPVYDAMMRSLNAPLLGVFFFINLSRYYWCALSTIAITNKNERVIALYFVLNAIGLALTISNPLNTLHYHAIPFSLALIAMTSDIEVQDIKKVSRPMSRIPRAIARHQSKLGGA